MKKLFLTMSLLLSMIAVQAADFKVTTNGGDVYFNIVDADAKTCEYAPNPDGPYHLAFTSTSPLSATVTNPNDGQTYTVIGVGENAFKDGEINSDGAGASAAHYTHMWWWPNTISYIRAGAFENTKSNFPCPRFNSGFTPGSIDKAAFINNRINQFNNATSGDYYKVTNYDQGNTGDINGRSGVLYCEENGVKTLLVYGGDHHRSSWEYKADGTQGAPNSAYYTLTTSVDLSEWNVIGENAFYGNQNITTITLGANLTTIETNAFKNVTSITNITCNALTPPTGAVFEDVVYERIRNGEGTITVPDVDAYKADPNWVKFWELPPTRVTIVEAEHGEVTADNVNPEDGATVTLTVTPETGYTLKNISVVAVIDPGNAQAPRRAEGPGVGVPVALTTVTEGQTYTFVMPNAPLDVKVTSEFEIVDYTVTVAEGIEHGTVVADKQTAHYGETVNLTVTPAQGYELETLTYTVEGDDPVAIENNAFEMPAADVTITATFKAIDYTITVAQTENGTVEAPATANYGETVNLTVTPAEGYELETLTYTPEGGEAVNIENNAFTMPAANVTITATFKAIDYTVTVVDGIQNGTVVADKQTAHYGETVNLTVTPAQGYELETLTYTVEGAESVAIENNAFTMPAANVTITATFKAIDYTITVAPTENGTVQAPATANIGETVALGVTPAEGYQLKSITVTPETLELEVLVNENNEFTMPADNVTVTAEFELIPVILDGVVFAGNTYATWYGNQNLAVPEGVTAYVVTGVEGDASQIEEVSYIPANVGVLLYSTTSAESVSTVPYTGETATVTSMLQGGVEEMEITDGYVLYNDTFVLTKAGTLAAHRCYLPAPAGGANGAPMRLRIVRSDDVVTAINDVRAAVDGKVRYIDINGRVSDKPFQGVNIVVNADGTVTKMVK